MQLNGYRVEIPECIDESSTGHITMRHGSHFTLRLSNHHKKDRSGRPCDASVYLDGKHVGTYRIDYGTDLILEHPINDQGRFTAYRKDTLESSLSQLDTDSEESGLIKVVFKPGYIPITNILVYRELPLVIDYLPYQSSPYISYGCKDDLNRTTSDTSWSYTNSSIIHTCDLVSGRVGLSGYSNQEFRETSNLSYDEPSTTIYLRIAFREQDEPHPISPVYKVYHSSAYPRPLK